ncbi:Ferri-bacillibactin esterase BesA [Microbulbifer aggregans]|uniref:Ferri-bacillibactin esterase BesA n=2 Tax=Microbulbifer aggregans TaxID=1769779 RepID=A0A1C9W459_9GAMM|nr:Ferri-bacillibactin esterase BesA [Microbulbifer aggregans]
MKFLLPGLLLLLPLLSTAASMQPGFHIPRTEVLGVRDERAGRDYELFIKLPRSYSNPETRQKHYPVIYLTDAMYTFQIVSGATRFPMAVGKMREAIIVGVSWQKGIHSTPSRVRDYTPFHEPSWKLETGKAEAHLRFFREKVFPKVEQRFPVDAGNRTYVGNSLGGLLGAYALVEHPDMFHNYVIGSPSLWFNNGRLFSLLDRPREKNESLKHRVFLAVGSLERAGSQSDSQPDMVADTERFYRALRSKNYPGLTLEFRVIEGATHETAFPTTAAQGLYWLFKTSEEA